jgi:hypothetical protein
MTTTLGFMCAAAVADVLELDLAAAAADDADAWEPAAATTTTVAAAVVSSCCSTQTNKSTRMQSSLEDIVLKAL